MKKISLTQGQFAIVDNADFEDISQFKWHAMWKPSTRSYYAVRSFRLPNGKQTSELMHRRILGLERGDGRQGDHINHDTLDNQRVNIRIVTHQENQHNNLGKGYSWNKQHNKYMARIKVNGVLRYLGYYDTPREARAAYLEAKAVLHPTSPTLGLRR